ncbi:MAG: CRISPR-associated helicase Cas3' [Candidatus Obscuribacterales bacterium]|nr:CRISPR-associated helicase Cas3' [Candidatus Obscuribacterales bacterium]
MSTRLLAKSYDRRLYQDSPPDYALLTQHSRDVVAACSTLTVVLADLCLHNVGLEIEEYSTRLAFCLRTSGWLQDLGKANSHFQRLVGGDRNIQQLLRHEWISAILVWQDSQLRDWLKSVPEPDLLFAIWGAVCHHRKFDRFVSARGLSDSDVHVSHSDFNQILNDMSVDLGLPLPPQFATDFVLSNFQGSAKSLPSASNALRDLLDEFKALSKNYEDPKTRRLVALIKGLGICADVAASAVAARGKSSKLYSVSDFVHESLGRVGIKSQDIIRLISTRMGAPCSPSSDTLASPLDGFAFRKFQVDVSESRSALTLARAGCGSGKSLAAYLWAWSHCKIAEETRQNFRLFFCLPTTGTTTEHYKDYALESGIESELSHSRASVDIELLAKTTDQEDAEEDDKGNVVGVSLLSDLEKIDALSLWSTPLVVSTADLVLGLMVNSRKSVYGMPAVMAGAIVFDEIHAFDDRLFGHLLSFLQNFPNLPVLLMTASLPEERKNAIVSVRPDLNIVDGLEEFETLPRYDLSYAPVTESLWTGIRDCLAAGGKVLWVTNRVDWANEIYSQCRHAYSTLASIDLYHSRYRYLDRSEKHRRVIDKFKQPGRPCLLIATQVAEMSLDLSADLLISDLAPIPALIQRMGRANRYSTPSNVTPPARIVILPVTMDDRLPYSEIELRDADLWIGDLLTEQRALSQRDLSETFQKYSAIGSIDLRKASDEAIFFSRLWEMRPAAARADGYTITVVLEEDYLEWRATTPDALPPREWFKKREVAIPFRASVLSWSKCGFVPIAPKSEVTYEFDLQTLEGVGASWN